MDPEKLIGCSISYDEFLQVQRLNNYYEYDMVSINNTKLLILEDIRPNRCRYALYSNNFKRICDNEGIEEYNVAVKDRKIRELFERRKHVLMDLVVKILNIG